MRRGQDAGWGEEGFIDVESCEGTGLYMIRDRRKRIYEEIRCTTPVYHPLPVSKEGRESEQGV
jgi:hypothetical protein